MKSVGNVPKTKPSKTKRMKKESEKVSEKKRSFSKIPPLHDKHTDEEMMKKKVLEFVREHFYLYHHVIKRIQWNSLATWKGLPKLPWIIEQWGSWSAFMYEAIGERAGTYAWRWRYRETERKVFNAMLRFTEEHGRYPRRRDWKEINADGELPSLDWIDKHMGWRQLKKKLKQVYPLEVPLEIKERIINQGLLFFERYGYLPRTGKWTKFRDEMKDRNVHIVSKQRVVQVFKAWENFVDALYERIKVDDEVLKQNIINEYRHVVYHLHIIPDEDMWELLYSKGKVKTPLKTVVRVFKTFYNLHKEAILKQPDSLLPTVEDREFISKVIS